MPFNGSGVFQRVMSWIDDRNNGVKITADRHDNEDDNFASGLSQTICKNGESTTTARIPFAQGIGLNDGTASAPAINFSSDTNTGFFRPGADKIGISANGSKVVEVSSTGLTVTGKITSDNPAREVLTTTRTYYVRTDGNDSNNGLANTAGGAFKTLQRAWDVISGTIDLGGNLATIQVGNGTYIAGISDAYKPLVGGRVLVQGDPSTPSNVVISEDSDDCFEISDSIVTIYGLRMINSGGSAIHCYRTGIVNFEKVEFGTCTEAHVFCDNQGQAIGSGDYSIVGDAPSHWVAHTGGFITVGGRNITLTGSRTFSSAFAYAHAGIIEAVSNAFAASSPSGRRFVVDANGTIYTGSTTLTELPGNTAGDLFSGTYGTDLTQVQGTWTPTYTGRTAAGTTTYTSQNGWYVRDGKMVHFGGTVAWSNATGTGQAAINLPFTAAFDAVVNLYYSNHVFGSGKEGKLYLNASAGFVGLYASDPAGGGGTSVAVDSAGEIRFTGSYVAA